MKIVGLTGGIGSGKSTVAALLHELGVAVYDSDSRAKILMNSDQELKSEILSLFGSEAYSEGKLNRAQLAAAIFGDPNKRAELSALVHPAVRKDFDAWVVQQNGDYVVKEAAILFESGAYTQCDYVVTVNADLEKRIERCIKNRAMSRAEVCERVASQWTDEQRTENATFVLDNSGDLVDLKKAVRSIHVKILEKIG